MKELSIKEKVKAYDEALKRAVVAHKDEDRHLKATLERIFPELKESEDEKVRKTLIRVLNENVGNGIEKYGAKLEEALAWLEKKGEQKPAEWSEIDKANLEDSIYFVKEFRRSNLCDNESRLQNSRTCIEWLASLKDRVLPQHKQEWSEEDSPYYDDICEILINLLRSETANVNKTAVQKDLDWLKSLKPQNHWKPTEAQVSTMKYLAKYYAKGCDEPTRSIIEGLYEQLKQL